MSIIILGFALFLLLYLFFTNDQRFIAWFIGLNILFPAGLGFMIGNVSINLLRVTSILFPILLVLIKGIHKRKIEGINIFFIFYFILFIGQVLSSIFSENSASNYLPYLVDDFFQTFGLLYFITFYFKFNEPQDQVRLILKALIYVTLVSYTFGIVEIFTKKNIFELLQIHNLFNKSFHGSILRDSLYRISSIFNDSLQFGYYICLTFPLLLMSLKLFNKKSRLYKIVRILIVISPIMLYFVSSRTSTAMILLNVFFLITFIKWHNLTNSRIGRIVYIGIFGISIIMFIFSFSTVFNYTNKILGIDRDHFNDESLHQRNLQLVYLSEIVSSKDFFWGNGRINTYQLIENTDTLLSLDSMWIRLYLEGGILSLISFLLIQLKIIQRNFKLIILFYKKNYLLVYVIASLLSFLFMSTFSSNQELRVYFYTLILLSFYIPLFNQVKNESNILIFEENK